MNKKEGYLSKASIAAPCEAAWKEMEGDETVRFCQMCKLNVYNIASMSAKEAEHLIAKNEGRLCLRLYRRNDGTVLTDNCPVGLRRIRNRLAKVAVFSGLFALMSWLSANQAQAQGLVGAPVDGRYGQANEVGGLAGCGYDTARDILRVATVVSSLIAFFFPLSKHTTHKKILLELVVLICLPSVVYSLGALAIDLMGQFGWL